MISLHNIRLGHACNSSSTHSIVPLAALLEKRGATVVEDDDTRGHDYGWQRFTLASAHEKLSYLSLQLEGRVDEGLREQITGIPCSELADGYVDHQSRWGVPSGAFQAEFLADLAEYLRREDVVILGGNDNGDAPELEGQLPWEALGDRELAGRCDHADGRKYWALMNPESGDKVRFSFDGQPLRRPEDIYADPDEDDRIAFPADTPVSMSSLPELVDLKITQWCPYEKDCGFCYMDSGRQGAHGDINVIFAHLDAMADAGVFEVALGGGEPTLHPFFAWILEHGAKRGLAMNFTTKNFALFGQAEKREVVLEYATAVAFSVNNDRDFERFKAMREQGLEAGWVRRPYYGSTGTVAITLQCIPSVLPQRLLEEILEYAREEGVRLTLLGFKRTGRGKSTEGVNRNHRWVDALVKSAEQTSGWQRRQLEQSFAIDTLMAAECQPLFDQAGISPVWYGTQEGAFSCYIDAVEGLLGESSYIPQSEMQAHTPERDLGEAYRAMQVRRGIR